jgi:hypothetical protein
MRSTTRGPMGLNLGDIIVGAGSMVVNDETDLFDALELYKPGDEVDVQVLRPSSQHYAYCPKVFVKSSSSLHLMLSHVELIAPSAICGKHFMTEEFSSRRF